MLRRKLLIFLIVTGFAWVVSTATTWTHKGPTSRWIPSPDLYAGNSTPQSADQVLRVHVPPDTNGRRLKREPTYFIVASRTLRQGQPYRIAVHLLEQQIPVTVKATIFRNGVEIISASKKCQAYEPDMLHLKIPRSLQPGVYVLRVEGSFLYSLGRTAFLNESLLDFSARSISVLVQTDRPFYKQGQTVQFRVVPIGADMKPYNESVDVLMVDPNNRIVKRWMSRQPSLGIINLSYELPDQVVSGRWTVRVVTDGQTDEEQFDVEEYHQPRFEVDVNVPAFVIESDDYVIGTVEANYTSGAPVSGKLKLEISVHPPRTGYTQLKFDPSFQRIVHSFEGMYNFKIAMVDLERLASKLERMQVTITATVTDSVSDEKNFGYSAAIITSNKMQLKFLGSEPQVFKPTAPFKAYLALSHEDDSRVPYHRFHDNSISLVSTVNFNNGRTHQLPPKTIKMSPTHPGTWEIEVDLMSEPSINRNRLKIVKSVKLEAKYKRSEEPVTAELLVISQNNANNHHLSVATSTRRPQIGEFIVFHVRADFYLLEFFYMVLSKGVIVASGAELITSGLRTFAVSLQPSMAPLATIVIYYVSLDGDVIADSLTFPVNGVMDNKFNITVNGRKEKTGEVTQIMVRGKPLSFVGLSTLDKELYIMRAKNSLSLAQVLKELNRYDEGKNGTLTQTWISRKGDGDESVYFSAHNYAPDANRTFDYSGLIVFTDANVSMHEAICHDGFLACLSGGDCYREKNRCDGNKDCEDGSDETGCPVKEDIDARTWNVKRRNHIQRLYEGSWLWKDVQIGRRGYVLVNMSVPDTSSSETWILSGFSLSSGKGLGLLSNPIKFRHERPFAMKLEMPKKCVLGEQLGLRVIVFNNEPYHVQATISLGNSADYEFVAVESNEIPPNIRNTSSSVMNGEHHHPVEIPALTSIVVHIPIVPLTLGEINVTMMAQTDVHKISVVRKLTIRPEGVTQSRHTSVILDLSSRSYLIKYFDIDLPEVPFIPLKSGKYYVPNSNRAYLSVFGDVVGPLYPQLPVDSWILLDKPGDGGEQNMFNFAANLYTLMYMYSTNQRDLAVEKNMFHYMNKLYARQLTFQTSDGGFEMFRDSKQPSLWLTAFCARIFSEANVKVWEYLLRVDTSVISRSVSWMLKHQTSSGAFYEKHFHSYDRKMTSTSRDSDDHYRNVSLTAHVVLTLLTAKSLPGKVGVMASKSCNLAVNYLEKNVKTAYTFNDPFPLAITAYALTRASSAYANDAFNLLVNRSRDIEGMNYWGREVIPPPKYNVASNKPYLQARFPYKYDSSNIETTAYALLTLIERQALLQEPIVEWLNFQRLHSGGWASTQDSFVAYKALLDYTVKSGEWEKTDISLTVDVTSAPNYEKILNINGNNLAQLQTVEIPKAFGTVRLLIKGTGMAVAQLSVQYNLDNPEYLNQPPVEVFELAVTSKAISTQNSAEAAALVRLTSCQRWLNESGNNVSGLSVLEIGLPTGYVVLQEDLDAYVRTGAVPNLMKAQRHDYKTIFYFKYLDGNETCVDFTFVRWYPVANLTRWLSAKVYDFYAPEHFKEIMFEITELHRLSICDVCGSYECNNCNVVDSAAIPKMSPLLVAAFTIVALLMRTWSS